MAVSLRPLPKQGRVIRRPQHTWHTVTKPWQIQPIVLAPVLPGETLRNILFQARVITDPIRNPLIGWFCEYYFFYVKHRDLDERDTLVSMVLDYNTDVSGIRTAGADVEFHHGANGINFAKKCLKRVVEEYFRDEGEAWDTNKIGNIPVAKIDDQSWLHSATMSSAIDADDVTIPVDATPAPDVVYASDIDLAMRQWEFLRANNLTTMTYEQFLSTYGVRMRPEEIHVPELLRYVKQWQYPSNTVDPTDGSPSSAVSWAIAERADKDRFFREPGFIFGVSCVRPKVYRRNQDGSCAHYLDNAFAWLPAIMADDPATSLREFSGTTGPLQTINTASYVVDLRDLYLYGDQFLNTSPVADKNKNLVDLPTADLASKRYPDATDAAELFVDDAGTAITVRQDGVCSITIAGSQVDTTPSDSVRTM